MMLLRTLVLERNGQDAPVNGALLCGFAVGQTASNFLVYSMDEEVEPESSRVYIAVLRKKVDRYFLGAVESREDLQLALHVFKQILTLAASGMKAGGVTETQVPYHFVDLKGCKLPPARPEDHHSVIIKKALVMKVITLGMSAPTLPAIESASVIVPSIRFSSQMSSSPKAMTPSEPVRAPVHQQSVEGASTATCRGSLNDGAGLTGRWVGTTETPTARRPQYAVRSGQHIDQSGPRCSRADSAKVGSHRTGIGT